MPAKHNRSPSDDPFKTNFIKIYTQTSMFKGEARGKASLLGNTTVQNNRLPFLSRWIIFKFSFFQDCIHFGDSLLSIAETASPPRIKSTGSLLFLSLYVKLTNYKITTSQLQEITQQQSGLTKLM